MDLRSQSVGSRLSVVAAGRLALALAFANTHLFVLEQLEPQQILLEHYQFVDKHLATREYPSRRVYWRDYSPPPANDDEYFPSSEKECGTMLPSFFS